MKLRLIAVLLLAGCSAGSTTGTSAGGGSGGSGGGTAAGGGTGGTGGSGGGGTVDAGDPACASDGGSSKCGCPGFTFCESFEGASIEPSRWMVTTNGTGNTAVLDSAKSMRGSKSLHVTVKGNAGSTALLSTTKPFPAANNSFFGRAFVFAQAPIPIVHAGMFAASGPGIEVRLGLDHNGDIEPNYFGAQEYGIFTSNKSKMPTNVWSCLEWEYRGTGELHFFLNGTEMKQIEVLATRMPPWTAPTYDKFSLGMILYQGDTATAAGFDLWFDEVAFSTTRIGCTN